LLPKAGGAVALLQQDDLMQAVYCTGRPVGEFFMARFLRYDDALWPNVMAVVYVAAGYAGGLALMLADSLPQNIFGTLCLAHAMVIAAYLIHECAHNSLFRKNSHHKWLGEILLWVCGASYSQYEDVRNKHVRHHTDRADIVSFDYRERILAYPRLLKLIYVLEWLYIPAMEVTMHLLVIILPFVKARRKHRRMRVVTVLILRSTFFIWLSSISLKILLLYPLAYLMFLTLMRFMDVHQHTYELFETLDIPRGAEAKLRDREFEHLNTYSNLLSIKHPWVNLLVLNFSYHNVHHLQPGRPWYQLPGLHKELYGNDQRQVLCFTDLIKSYHRYRLQRVLNTDAINAPVKQLGEHFIGVDGVSFLTAH
jgi:fatty acid desaturase